MSEIPKIVVDTVLQQLHEIEVKHGVRVLYACESGSRAWGFASADSDYDVRFIYSHPQEWYLSIDLEHEPDVIEVPIDGELDISGWDLRKALKLFRKSNPALIVEDPDMQDEATIDVLFRNGCDGGTVGRSEGVHVQYAPISPVPSSE